MKPFLKWVGGKRKLLPQIKPYIPSEFDTYYEPFLGSGALFFDLLPKNAVLSDANAELINTYRVLRDRPLELIDLLRILERDYHRFDSKDIYYNIRNADREITFGAASALGRASRFIFLNKTCYSGMYRVNKQGEFNVPFGNYKNPKICDRDTLLACSEALQGIELKVADFRSILEDVRAKDLVYLDPPYVPTSATANFTNYNKDGFGEDCQIALFWKLNELDILSVKWIQSNSNTEWVRHRYQEYQQIEITRPGAMNSKSDRRGRVTELLVINT